MRILCLYFIAITFYGSAFAAGGPELTRRGMLFGLGASAVAAVKLPHMLTEIAGPSASNLSAAAARSAPAASSQFILIDEFQNASASDLEFMRKVLNVRTMDASNVYAVQAADFGTRNRVMQMAIGDGLNFSEGLARTVERQTFSAIQSLVEKKPNQPLEAVERLIEKMEPNIQVPCETKVTRQEALLVIEEKKISGEPEASDRATSTCAPENAVCDGSGVPHRNSPHR